MKTKLLIFLLIIFYNSIFSQEKKEVLTRDKVIIDTPENGRIENGVYICNLFEWQINIPNNYQITDSKRTEELENKGYEAMKKEIPNGVKVNRHPTQLIGFESSKYNNFKSSYESLVGTKKTTLEEHKKFSEKLLIDTYSNVKELRFELNSSDIKLGKYNFYKIQIRLYNPKNDKLLLTQEIYNSFINNHLFSVAINYTNENDGLILNYTFTKSFEK